jgi:hypothetical protein
MVHIELMILPDNHAAKAGRWPKTLTLGTPGLGEVLFCHATPQNENEIFTRLTPEERFIPVFEYSLQSRRFAWIIVDCCDQNQDFWHRSMTEAEGDGPPV